MLCDPWLTNFASGHLIQQQASCSKLNSGAITKLMANVLQAPRIYQGSLASEGKERVDISDSQIEDQQRSDKDDSNKD